MAARRRIDAQQERIVTVTRSSTTRMWCGSLAPPQLGRSDSEIGVAGLFGVERLGVHQAT
jgi:hypothetical protein